MNLSISIKEKYLRTDMMTLIDKPIQDSGPFQHAVRCGFIHSAFYNWSRRHITDYAVNLVLSGQGRYLDANGFEAELRPGSFIQRFPNVEFEEALAGDPATKCYLALPAPMLAALRLTGALVDETPVMQLGSAPEIPRLIQDLMRFWRMESVLQPALTVARAYETMVRVHAAVAMAGRRPGSDRQRIKQACALLSAHLDQRRDIEKVARAVHMSSSNFRRVFKKQVGLSPAAYRIQCRITQAKALIEDGHLTIKQIADTLGYPDVYVFSKQFKKETGVSPSRYRQEIFQANTMETL